MKYFQNLYKTHQQLLLLEWFYGIFATITLVVASLIGLLNESIGAALLIIPLISLITLATNLVCWALIKLFADHFCASEHVAESAGTKKPARKTAAKSVQTAEKNSAKKSA